MRQHQLGSVFLPAIVSSLGLLASLTSCGQSASTSADATQAAPAARALGANANATALGKRPSTKLTKPTGHSVPIHRTWRTKKPTLHDGLAPHGPSLHAAIVQTVQAESKAAHFATLSADRSSVRMQSAEQGLSATMDARGLKLRASQTGTAHDIGFKLSGYGCASSVAAMGSDSQLRASGARSELDHGSVVEWYQNGRLGLEQGFDLGSAPACREGVSADRDDAVVLTLDLEHKLQAELMENRGEQWLDLRDEAGEVVLRYSDLYAEDANLKQLPAKMSLSGKKLTLRIDDRGARYPLRVDPLIWAQVGGAQKAATPHAGDLFGMTVAVSGDHAVVGAPHDGEGGANAGAGYIFQLSAQGVWTEQVKYLGPQPGALMGSAVAIDDAGGGNKRVVIGIPGDDDSAAMGVDGSAVWFVGVGSSFNDDGAFGGAGKFGSSVAASGGRIIVGGPDYITDPLAPTPDGWAVIYAPDTSQTPPWGEDTQLFGNLGSGEHFGSAVALSNDLAAIGAPSNANAGANAGAAYVYQRNSPGTGWSLKATLVSSDTVAGDTLGKSVAVFGQTVLAGAPAKNGGAGGAYAFVSSGGVWNEQQKLHNLFTGTLKANDNFGASVSGAGNLAAIGAPLTDSKGLTDSGAVYVINRAGAVWSLRNIATAKDPAANERFGSAVSVEATSVRILVGAPGYDGGVGTDTGAFYELILRKQNGDPCLAATECASDYCIDGFCCDSFCGGNTDSDCQACATAKGASANGTCTMASAGAAFVCRPAAGVCDVAEVCTGASTQCPAEAFKTGTVCRAEVAGGCDQEEVCSGASANCPNDVVKSMGTMCRTSKGACDVSEICNGISNTCPGDAKVPMGLVCRAAVGLCDKPEACDGSTDACPTDAYLGTGTVCRAAAGICDVDEVCGGSSPNCPTDAFLTSATVCRAAVNPICDKAESCTGTSATCPTDMVAGANTVCRDSVDVCDSKEVCDGTSGACPGDIKVAAGVTCRPAAGVCDQAEACNGSANACPPDNFLPSSSVCRASAGVCDVAESCTGTGVNCPGDGFLPSSTVCRAAVSTTCDTAESCTGTTAACPTDMVMPANTVCRAPAGLCDAQEVCDGTSGACPGDTKIANAVVCRPAAGVCDIAEACNGVADACPPDTLASSATVCRASAGVCDVAESCTGTGVNCPGDAFLPSSTVCRPAVSTTCDTAESCTGSTAACPTDIVMPVNTVCRAPAGLCDAQEVCDGTSGACPGDTKIANAVVCRPAAGVCDIAEACNGVADACPPDTLASSATVCRPVAGICDVAESCTGASVACPGDSFLPSSTVCRASAGVCDVVEQCTGGAAACPSDTVIPVGTSCRASAGPCDVAEVCDGLSGSCPGDFKVPNGVTCRPAAGICDQAEACNGSADACPGDVFMPSSTVCRASTGPCDIVEQCTGSTAACPNDVLRALGETCRASGGICDIAELCDGKTGDCSDDIKVASGTLCRVSAGICDVAEACDGTNDACPVDAFAGAEVTCRPAADDCDLPDVCDSSGIVCPADVKAPNNSACSAGSCQAAICRVESDLVVAAAPAPVYTGPEPDLAFTIGVGNVGRSPTTAVVLSVQVPAGTVLVKANGDSWACEIKSDTEIECRRATLGVSENTLVSLSLRPPAAAESFALTASVVSTIFDPVTSNNTATVSQSLLTPRYSGGGVSCSVAVGSAPARSAGPVGSMLLLLGLAGLLTMRRRRSS